MIEKQILDEFLNDYSDVLGNRGCNDYELKDTPENREFVERFNKWVAERNPQDPPQAKFSDGSAITYDWLIVHYLIDWIKNDQK